MCIKTVTTKGQKLVDLQERHVILHGVNMVCKDKNANYIGSYKIEDFETLQKWGFNVIRLGIFWDAVEPQPGIYDDVYLSKIDTIIELAGNHDISVFLDMHQDLYSYKYADGAPEWATITDGCEHVQTELWSEAYLLSGAVQTAFDNFWNNKKAVDGVGIQDHYIKMWKHIAARYNTNQKVIGYDIMNEPFLGSNVNELMPMLLKNAGEAIFKDEIIELEELMAIWMDPTRKMELMNALSDKELYRDLMKSVEGVPQQFEKTFLNEFYHQVSRAIREVDEKTMIFLEANYFSNAGMMSGILPITDDNDIQDSKQVFSPHGYDILVDTDLYDQASNVRIDVIFETHKKVQEKLAIPMLIGEWGCFPDAKEEQLPQAAYLINSFEKYLASDTYFDFSHLSHNLLTKVIVRAYPMKAAGEILCYRNDFETLSFYCEIKESLNTGNSIIYIPEDTRLDNLSIEPYGNGYTVETIQGGSSGYLSIPSIGDETIRRIRF